MKFYFFVFTLLFIMGSVTAECFDLSNLEYNQSQFLNYNRHSGTERNISFINESITLCENEYLLKDELIYINSSDIVFDCDGAIISKIENEWPYRPYFIKFYGYYGTFDNHILKNITIQNCIFKNIIISSVSPIHHVTYAHVRQFAYDNINFINNTFIYSDEENIGTSLQTVLNFNHIQNSRIENNTFINSGFNFEVGKNLTLKNNKFTYTNLTTTSYFRNVYLSNVINNVFITNMNFNVVDSNITNNYFYGFLELIPSCAPPKSLVSFENNVLRRNLVKPVFFETNIESNIFLWEKYVPSNPNYVINFDNCYR